MLGRFNRKKTYMGLILSSRRKYILDGIKISTKNLKLKLRYVSGLTQRTEPKRSVTCFEQRVL